MTDFNMMLAIHFMRFIIGWIIFFMLCNEKIQWRRMSGMIILGMIIVTVLPVPFHLVAMCTMFFYHYYYHKNYQLKHHVLYSFFPFAILNLLSRLILLFILPFLLNLPDKSVTSNLIYIFISVVLSLPSFIFLLKVFNIQTFSFIRHYSKKINRFLIFSDIGTISYLLLIPFLNGSSNEGNWLKRMIVLLFFCIFLFVMSHLSTYARQLAVSQIEEEKVQHIELLEKYNDYIEELYKSIKSFKHDYDNMLITLTASIDSQDMETIEKAFYSIVDQMETSVERPLSINLERFDKVQAFDLKTLLALRFYEANQKGIDTAVKIDQPLKSEITDPSNMIVIISTIVKLAIERSERTNDPYLSFSYRTIDKHQSFQVISNTDLRSELKNMALLDLIERSNLILDAYLEKYPQMTYRSKIIDNKYSQSLHFDNNQKER
ncbi:hypothetical protein [Streptococcus penaeicida]